MQIVASPEPGFQIAIHGLPTELRTVHATGLYCIAAASRDHLGVLARQILGSATPSARGVLITADDLMQGAAAYQLPECDLRVYQLTGSPLRALPVLTRDLNRTLRPRRRTIILLLPATYLHPVLTRVRPIFETWVKWLRGNGCTLLVLAETSLAELTAALMPVGDLLSGIAAIEEYDTPVYRAEYWRSAKNVQGTTTVPLALHGGKFIARTEPGNTRASVTAYPAGVLFHTAALAGQPVPAKNGWRTCDTTAELFEQARLETNSTIVFVLQTHNQLPQLARILHTLRLERGPDLKLVVRELGMALRHHDEQRLLSCGATLAIPANATLPHFFSLLESIQTARYDRALATDPDSLFLTEVKQTVHSIVTVQAFTKQILTLLDTETTASPVVLVRLDLVSGLSIDQALGELDLKRAEDLACTLNSHVYLYLYGCHPVSLPTALARVFRLPYQEIFSGHIVFPEGAGIRAQCRRMQLERPHAQEPLTNAMQNTPAATAQRVFGALAKSAALPSRYAPRLKALAVDTG